MLKGKIHVLIVENLDTMLETAIEGNIMTPKGATMNDEFKNLRLFILDVALSAEINDSNAWHVDCGVHTYVL
jgi:hypothetical protein